MVNLNTGSGTGGEAMGDTLKNIELIWGSTHGDTFIASEGVDTIHGDGGSDTVSYEASKHGVTVVLPTTDDTTQYTFTPGDSTATPPTMDMVEFDAQLYRQRLMDAEQEPMLRGRMLFRQTIMMPRPRATPKETSGQHREPDRFPSGRYDYR